MANRYSPSAGTPASSASSSMAACPSYPTCWQTPASAATASNSRPMLVVGTHPEPEASIESSSRRSGAATAATAGRRSSQPRPAERRCDRATRAGCSMAASPPGSATGARCATRLTSRHEPSSTSPPQMLPSVPYPVPSKVTPITSSCDGRWCSASNEPRWAWWCCTSTRRAPVCSAWMLAHRRDRNPGWLSAATTAGTTRDCAARTSTVRSSSVSDSSDATSPRCWLSQPRRPSARHTVALSSPPTASVGATSAGRRTGTGA